MVLVLALMALGLLGTSYGQTIINCPVFTSSGPCGVSYSHGSQVFWAQNGTLSGSQVLMAATGSNHNGYVLNYSNPVNVQAFTASFSFIPNGQNISFVAQNNTNTAAAGGGSGFSAGAGCESGFYQVNTNILPPNNIFALELDSYSPLTNNGSFSYSNVQIYQSGQSPCLPNDNGPYYYPTNKVSTSPVPLDSPATSQGTTSGHTYSATLVYTGTNLTLSLYDVTGGGSCPGSSCFTHTWNGVQIPSIVGNTTAYIGLTAGVGQTSAYPLYANSFSYTALSAAAAPSCSPGTGTYSSAQSVTCSDTSANSTICYNATGAPYTDGNGNCPNGTKYTGAISISAGETLYLVAGAGGSGYGDSPVTSYTYGIGSTTPQPAFSLTTASYNGNQTAVIACPPGTTCYYTTNGSTPTPSSTRYTTPITISSTTNLQAIAVAADVTSAVSSINVTINPFAGQAPANSPTFTSTQGTSPGTQIVTMTCSTPSSYGCYVLSSTTPTLLPQPNNEGGCNAGTLASGTITVLSGQAVYGMCGTNLLGPPSSLVVATLPSFPINLSAQPQQQ